jgi:hypothetical protein
MLVYQCASAQDYLITSKGDSIAGEIKPLSFGPEKKVQIMVDGKKNVYSIYQTRSFRFKNEIYQPVKKDNGYVFMKLLKEGYLSLYAFQMENQVTYDGRYMMKRDGSGLEVPNLTFKKSMIRYLNDCPSVTEKIDAGALGKKSIDTIIDAYNQCIANNTIDHTQSIAQVKKQQKKISAWDVLEEKVKGKSDFEGKSDALEMIADIRDKIKRNEKIPNFLLDGLKSSLSKTDLTAEYESAVQEIKN